MQAHQKQLLFTTSEIVETIAATFTEYVERITAHLPKLFCATEALYYVGQARSPSMCNVTPKFKLLHSTPGNPH